MGFAHEVTAGRRDRCQGRGARRRARRQRADGRPAPARSWCRTSPAARSRPSCAPRRRGGIADIRASAEGKEGVSSFLEKRKPSLAAAALPDGTPLDLDRPSWSRSPPRSAGRAACASTRWCSSPARPAALGWVDLPGGLQLLQSPWLLGASGVLLFVEFFVDKIPGLDSVWDALHTADPHSRRRGAGGRRSSAATRPTWTTVGGAARRRSRRHQPRRQGDHPRRRQHLARAVLEHRPVAARRRPGALRPLAVVGASGAALRRPRRRPAW